MTSNAGFGLPRREERRGSGHTTVQGESMVKEGRQEGRKEGREDILQATNKQNKKVRKQTNKPW
jgi:hypothetical protein